jgi:hypothetical protein
MSECETVPSSGTSAAAAASALPDGRLPFTNERLAFLRPRLEQLIADLAFLDPMVDPSAEPAFTPRDAFGEDRHAR